MVEGDEPFGDERPREEERFVSGPDKFRKTAAGSVLAAGLMGLADALEGPRDDKVAIVTEYAGEPPFGDRLVLRLDPDDPSDSIVMIRPWLQGD